MILENNLVVVLHLSMIEWNVIPSEDVATTMKLQSSQRKLDFSSNNFPFDGPSLTTQRSLICQDYALSSFNNQR